MELAPISQPSSEPLFGGSEPVGAEVERLLAWVRALLETREPEAAHIAAWAPIKRAVPGALVARIRGGEAPPVAIEVLAGLTSLVLANHRMRAFWHAAWDLSEPAIDARAAMEARSGDALLSPEDRALVADVLRDHGRDAAGALSAELEEAAREEIDRARARDARRSAGIADRAARDPERAARFRETLEIESRTAEIIASRERLDGAPAASPELVTTAQRLAPIGAGGPTRVDMAEVRGLLFANRAAGPAWEALCAAFDAIGAASFAALDRLGAIARANPGSPAIAWLDEIACGVAREGRRAESAARLDALLASGELGRNARHVVASVRLGREALASSGTRAHDAWLRLWSVPRDERPAPRGPGSALPPERRAVLLRAARRGHELAKLLVAMDEAAERAGAAGRAELDREGPFHGLAAVPDEISEPIDAIACHAVLGFREAYGLELLRDGAPRLRAWLATTAR